MDSSGLPESDCEDPDTQVCKLMPPIIEDEETVDTIDTASDTMKGAMQLVTLTNLLVAILLGGVLQHLYGMIKVM
jgi:hypothetical protein